MNLYLISQESNTGYDTFDSAVVAAPSETIARHMNPRDGKIMTEEQWKENFSDWCDSPDKVTVKLIGTSIDSEHQGVVCASFNAV